MFGIPGSALVDLWDAFAKTPSLRVIRSTSELMSSFMANGYARASGSTAVLCTIAGPGLTYAVSGIAEAFLDSIPIVYIVDAGAGMRQDGAPGLQAIDQVGVLRPIVKDVIEVGSANDVAEATRAALALASAGEPGPVLLQIALGALQGQGSVPDAQPPGAVAGSDVDAIAERVRLARRPVIVVGQGAAAAAHDVRRFADWLKAPVVATTSGRGVVSEEHPLSLASDVPGGSVKVINEIVSRSDLVLALGCKLSHNGSRGYSLQLPPERLIRVDSSADVLPLNYPAELVLQADVGGFMAELERRLVAESSASEWDPAEIGAARAQLAAEVPDRLNPRLGPGTASELFAAVRRQLPDRGIIATDSGLHQYLVRAHFRVREPRTLLVPTDFQSMGYGVPAAIGGSLASGEPAVVVTGDGGLNIVGLELLTAVRERVPLTVIVLVDGYLGLIRLSQLARTGRMTDVDVTTPRLGLFAEAVGAEHVLLDGDSDSDELLQAAIASGNVTIVEVPMLDPPGLGKLKARGRALAMARGVVDGRLGRAVGRR